MKKLIALIIFAINFAGISEAKALETHVEYISNYDGDTIKVNFTALEEKDSNNDFKFFWSRLSVRVAGVDTPEMKGKCYEEKKDAKKAKEFVKSLLSNAHTIKLKNMKRGKYFRIVADVIVDGENLSDLLMDANLAVPYDGGTKSNPWCEKKDNSIIEFVNSANFLELDEQAKLSARAAWNIVAHRNGPDGKLGTKDDRLFKDLDELDAVKYVGKSTMKKIKEYVNGQKVKQAGL